MDKTKEIIRIASRMTKEEFLNKYARRSGGNCHSTNIFDLPLARSSCYLHEECWTHTEGEGNRACAVCWDKALGTIKELKFK